MKACFNLLSNRLHALPLMVLYLTEGCNSRCASCDIWRQVRRDMPLALVDQLVSSAAELDVRWVLLSGGEAMQHPQWPEIARRFREVGAHVMLLTNGLLLRRQAEAVAASVDEVVVSLDGGTAATYEALRGVDAFDLVLDGIRLARQNGLPVTTRTTIQRANFREMPTIIDLALNLDVNAASFLAVDVSSEQAFGPRSLTSDLSERGALNHEEWDELAEILDVLENEYAALFAAGRIAESPAKLRHSLLDYFGALLGRSTFSAPRCNAPHTSVVVEVDGRLRPCYFLPAFEHLRPTGHLAEGQTLARALNGTTARALRQAYRRGQRAECERCVCPLYKGPRALLRM